jgi:uncharacterized membrane protein YuzA (DUF378 family)
MNIFQSKGNPILTRQKNGGNCMDIIALILSIIGSINWGLVSIFQFDLVAWIFGGQDALLSRIVYGLVGLAGLWCITILVRRFKESISAE